MSDEDELRSEFLKGDADFSCRYWAGSTRAMLCMSQSWEIRVWLDDKPESGRIQGDPES